MSLQLSGTKAHHPAPTGPAFHATEPVGLNGLFLLIFPASDWFHKPPWKIPAPLLHNSTRILELRLSNNFHDGSVPQGLGNLPFLEIRLSWFAIDKIRLEVRNSRVHWQPLQVASSTHVRRQAKGTAYRLACYALRNASPFVWLDSPPGFVADVLFEDVLFEYLSNGSLEDWIKGKKKNADGDGLNILERFNVAIDVPCGLDYLHHDSKVPVVHCDSKPSNILLDGDVTAKIGDFGLAKVLMERTENTQHSQLHQCPEGFHTIHTPSSSLEKVQRRKFHRRRKPHQMGAISLPSQHDQSARLCAACLLKAHISSRRTYLVLIFEVGLSCTCASPDGRSSLRKAPYKLETARQTLLNVESVNCQALT
ncbi:hypothetical protein ACFX2J_042951 [Malus domestica]